MTKICYFMAMIALCDKPTSAFSISQTLPTPVAHAQKPPTAVNNKNGIYQTFDTKRIRNGQRFFQENCVAISMAWYCYLVASFSTPEPAEALLQTGQSDTAERAERRYMQRTIPTILSWHADDFGEGTRATRLIDVVNQSHKAAAFKSSRKSKGKCPFSRLTRGISSPQSNGNVCGSIVGGECGAFSYEHMAAVQMGFVTGAVSCSEAFGMSSTRGLEDFVYLWYVLGKLLGLKDEHNKCTSLERAQEGAKELRASLSADLSAALRSKDQRFETLLTAFLEGTNQHLPIDISRDVALKLSVDCIGLDLEEDMALTTRQLSRGDRLTYGVLRWTLSTIGRLSVRARLGIHHVQKRLFLR